MKNASLKTSTSGFTLIEIVSAIALFSILMVGVASMLGQTNLLNTKLRSRQVSVQAAQISFNKIERDLQMAFNENIQKSQSLFAAREGATGQELVFSYLDSPIKTLYIRRSFGMKFARYALEKSESGLFQLIRSETPLYLADRIEDSAFQVIARGIVGWKLEFYDYRNDQWLKTWDSRGNITGGYFPLAVKLHIEVTDPELPPEQRQKKSLVFESSILLLNEYMVRK